MHIRRSSPKPRNPPAPATIMKQVPIFLIASLVLCSCAHYRTLAPDIYVEDRPDGFVVRIVKTEVQQGFATFVPRLEEMRVGCRSEVVATARRVAESRARAIQPIGDQQISVSVATDGFARMTQCIAKAWAKWQ